MIKYTISIALLILANISYGQGFEAYVIGGVNFSQIDGDKLSGYNKIGLVVGGVTSFKLKGGWSFQQEIIYSQRGSRATSKQLSFDNFSIKRLDYIDVIAQVHKVIKDKWGFIGGIGYGVFIKVKSDVTEDKALYKFDLFPTIGVEHQLADNLFAVIKAQYSFKTIFETQNAWNNNLSLSLRYRLIQ